MRPRLREDVQFVEIPDGAYVQGDLGACTLRGSRAYAWLSRLAPALTGEHALADLTGQLPHDKRQLVEQLVHQLAEQRLVVDVRADQPHTLTEAEQRTYQAEIAFVGYALDSPQWRFQRLRSARITVVGDGDLLRALLAAGLSCGWRQVRVVVTSGSTADLPGVIARARRDPAQRVRVERDAAGQPGLAAESDVVLQVGAGPDLLVAMCHRYRDTAAALGQMLIRPAEAWLAPVCPPVDTAAESGWLRLQGLPAAEPPATVDWLTGPVPDLLAGQLALSCFSYLTGLDELPEGWQGSGGSLLTRVDLPTLDTRPHRFLVHPGAGPAPARVATDRLAAAPPIPAAELRERAAALVDPRTGVLGSLDEEDLPQVPLAVCRATVSDPGGSLPPATPPPEVFGWGAEPRALLAALATYASMVDPGPSGADEMWGVEVPSGQPRPVPAREVYPDLAGAEIPYRAPVGTAAGHSWPDAVAAGLRDHSAVLLAERLATTAAVSTER